MVDYRPSIQGYMWSFPGRRGGVIGIGGAYSGPSDSAAIRQELESYLASRGLPRDGIMGSFVPYGRLPKRVVDLKKGIFLLGDAAGSVDPITGEGLYFCCEAAARTAAFISRDIGARDFLKYIERQRHAIRSRRCFRKIAGRRPILRYLLIRPREGRRSLRLLCDLVVSRGIGFRVYLGRYFCEKLLKRHA